MLERVAGHNLLIPNRNGGCFETLHVPMTIRKLITRVTVIGFVQIGIVAGLLFAFSGSLTVALDSNAPPVAEAAAIVVSNPLDTSEAEAASFAGGFVRDGPFTISGAVSVVEDDLGQFVLRFTDRFQTNRGPELSVYLRSSSGEFIDLGELQSFLGGQDYDIPELTDLTEFDEVQIWDERSDMSLGSAVISPV